MSNSSFHARLNGLEQKINNINADNQTLIQFAEKQEQQSRLIASLTSQLLGMDVPAYYLVCEAGYPNYGDELIAREWLRYLLQVHPEIPIYLDCARPGPSMAILGKEHPRVRVVDTISRLTVENEHVEGAGNVQDVGQFVSQALTDDGVAARYASGIQILREKIRSVHFVGGGYMNGRWYANLARLELGRWAADRGIPAIATGVGLMPLDATSTQYVQELLPYFDTFTVRDEDTVGAVNVESGENTCEKQVMLAPDDCFVNGLEGCYSEEIEFPRIMVYVQSDLVSDQEKLISHVVGTVKAWQESDGEPIGVIECNPYIDYPIVEALEEAGCAVQFYPLAYLLNVGFPAAQGQRWLTTRYHPHILAAAKGCEGSYISVDKEYYSTKHNAVLRMGSHWTQSVIGEGVVEPGPGFDNPQLPQLYSEQIRASVAHIYGEK
nr:polysaccharide pyruvyl transferase family protein [Alloscardovia criceti]